LFQPFKTFKPLTGSLVSIYHHASLSVILSNAKDLGRDSSLRYASFRMTQWESGFLISDHLERNPKRFERVERLERLERPFLPGE